jgi:hypothetical protein
MHDRDDCPGGCRPRRVPPGASRASNMLRHDSATHDSLRQINLSQLTHLSRGIASRIEAEEAIWHIAASELLNHDSMRQMNLSQATDDRSWKSTVLEVSFCFLANPEAPGWR